MKRTRIEALEPPEDCLNCLAKRDPIWVEPRLGFTEHDALIADDEGDKMKRADDVNPAELTHWGVGNGVLTRIKSKRSGSFGGGGGLPPVDDIEGGVDVGNRFKKRGDGGHDEIELSDNPDSEAVDHQAIFKDWGVVIVFVGKSWPWRLC